VTASLARPGWRPGPPQAVDALCGLGIPTRRRASEHLVGGWWAPAPVDPDGRADTAGIVLRAPTGDVRAAGSHPWRLQSLAWAASGALRVDEGTSTADLLGLAREHLDDVRVLPVGDPVGGTLARFPTAETRSALIAAGLSCRP
jgi:hypothetical protein